MILNIEDDIEGFATGMGESFFAVDLVEGRSKDFSGNNLFEFGQEIIELVDFGEWSFKIEEGWDAMFHRKNGKRRWK